jgi:surface polysaccharide O-acyltransferase-like enzyme
MIATQANVSPAPAGSAVVSGSSPRWPLLDVARWPAIYAIVWLHTMGSPHSARTEYLDWSTVLTRFAVPFFVAACVFLVLQGVWHKPQRTFLQYARNRFLRIYVPFLAWSAVYLGFKLVKGRFLPGQRNDFPGIEILWTGGFYHLWFMPFILVVSLAAFPIAKIVHGCEWLRWPIAIGSLAAAVALSTPVVAAAIAPDYSAYHNATDARQTISRATSDHQATVQACNLMVDTLPAMFWAMAVGLAFGGGQVRSPAGSRRIDKPLAASQLLLFVGSMVWLGAFGRSALMENLAGVSLLLIGLYPTDSRVLCRVARFPALAYGIYLSHMLPMKVCEALATRRGLSPSWQLDCAIFLASAIAATLIAWILYRSRWTRWLVA